MLYPLSYECLMPHWFQLRRGPPSGCLLETGWHTTHFGLSNDDG